MAYSNTTGTYTARAIPENITQDMSNRDWNFFVRMSWEYAPPIWYILAPSTYTDERTNDRLVKLKYVTEEVDPEGRRIYRYTQKGMLLYTMLNV